MVPSECYGTYFSLVFLPFLYFFLEVLIIYLHTYHVQSCVDIYVLYDKIIPVIILPVHKNVETRLCSLFILSFFLLLEALSAFMHISIHVLCTILPIHIFFDKIVSVIIFPVN